MTGDEREALVERMAEALWDAMPHATPYKDLTDAAKRLARCMACRALAEAERVVREDEREACWNVAIDEMLAAEADVETASDEDLVARLQSQGAASAAGRIATFIRARGAA